MFLVVLDHNKMFEYQDWRLKSRTLSKLNKNLYPTFSNLYLEVVIKRTLFHTVNDQAETTINTIKLTINILLTSTKMTNIRKYHACLGSITASSVTEQSILTKSGRNSNPFFWYLSFHGLFLQYLNFILLPFFILLFILSRKVFFQKIWSTFETFSLIWFTFYTFLSAVVKFFILPFNTYLELVWKVFCGKLAKTQNSLKY